MLPLPPIEELAVPARLAKKIRYLFASLTDAHGDSRFYGKAADQRAWQETTRRLLKKVNRGSEQALVELVKHDRRYLGSPLVTAKVLEWLFYKLLAQERVAGRGKQLRREQQGAKASRLLDGLGAAIPAVFGKAPPDLYLVQAEYRNVWSGLRAAERLIHQRAASGRKPNAKVIAAKVRLTTAEVQQLIERPTRFMDTAQRIMAARFGLGKERIRALLVEIKRLPDDVED